MTLKRNKRLLAVQQQVDECTIVNKKIAYQHIHEDNGHCQTEHHKDYIDSFWVLPLRFFYNKIIFIIQFTQGHCKCLHQSKLKSMEFLWKKKNRFSFLGFTERVESIFARFDWHRERILGRRPGYVNFITVIFRGCNFLRRPHTTRDCFKAKMQNIVMAAVEFFW